MNKLNQQYNAFLNNIQYQDQTRHTKQEYYKVDFILYGHQFYKYLLLSECVRHLLLFIYNLSYHLIVISIGNISIIHRGDKGIEGPLNNQNFYIQRYTFIINSH